MGGTMLTFRVESLGKGSKFADAYRYAWWLFDAILKDFGIQPEPHIQSYLEELTWLENQQHILGKRPYSRHEFQYLFPDYLGAGSLAAELSEHWFEVALALWETEHASYFKGYHLRLLTPLKPLRACVSAAAWIELRGINWLIEQDCLMAQDFNDKQIIAFDELSETERNVVEAARRSGLCHCRLCRQLIPVPEAEEQLTKQIVEASTWHERVKACLWIGSLLEPRREWLTWLFEVGLPTLGPCKYHQFSPPKAKQRLLNVLVDPDLKASIERSWPDLEA
jgi:hypothetical protein